MGASLDDTEEDIGGGITGWRPCGNKPIFLYICSPELKNSGFYYV